MRALEAPAIASIDAAARIARYRVHDAVGRTDSRDDRGLHIHTRRHAPRRRSGPGATVQEHGAVAEHSERLGPAYNVAPLQPKAPYERAVAREQRKFPVTPVERDERVAWQHASPVELNELFRIAALVSHGAHEHTGGVVQPQPSLGAITHHETTIGQAVYSDYFPEPLGPVHAANRHDRQRVQVELTRNDGNLHRARVMIAAGGGCKGHAHYEQRSANQRLSRRKAAAPMA